MTDRYVRSGAAGAGTGVDWTNAYVSFNAAATAGAAGDRYWVSDDHAENPTGATATITFKGTNAASDQIYCVDHTIASGFSSANLKTTATLTGTGGTSINFNGCFAINGVGFNIGDGTNLAALLQFNQSGATNITQRFYNCTFVHVTTASGSFIQLGNQGGRCVAEWNNCTLQFASTSQQMRINGVTFSWKNTTGLALKGSATTSGNPIFGAVANSTSNIYLEGLDLSNLTGTGGLFPVNIANNSVLYTVKDCKINAATNFFQTASSFPAAPGDVSLDYLRVDSAGTNYKHGRYRYSGSQVIDSTVARTGGATDGAVPFSEKLVTTANSTWFNPLEMMPAAIWNRTSGNPINVTTYGLCNGSTMPFNDEAWCDIQYLGSASSPISSRATCTKSDGLAPQTALTVDTTSTWTSVAPARANTTGYVSGAVIKTSGNANLPFFCAAGGTTAGSEPAGYASALDGQSVTDGTAIFRAGYRFAMAIALNNPAPAMAGYLTIYFKAAKPSTTYYIDPEPVLS